MARVVVALATLGANRLLLGSWAMPGNQPLCSSLQDVKVLLGTLALLLLASFGPLGEALIARAQRPRSHGLRHGAWLQDLEQRLRGALDAGALLARLGLLHVREDWVHRAHGAGDRFHEGS